MSKTARLEAKRPQPANYEDDFHAWTVHQAQLLRTGQLGEADVENIAEEIETLGRSEAAALRSSLRLIVLHLLKFGFQPDRASRSWRVTVVRRKDKCPAKPRGEPKLEAEARAAV